MELISSTKVTHTQCSLQVWARSQSKTNGLAAYPTTPSRVRLFFFVFGFLRVHFCDAQRESLCSAGAKFHTHAVGNVGNQ